MVEGIHELADDGLDTHRHNLAPIKPPDESRLSGERPARQAHTSRQRNCWL